MKATIATVKSFVRKNKDNLLILVKSSFDGMTDMCEYVKDPQFKPAQRSDLDADSHTLGIAGVWIVGSSRDRITPFEDGEIKGFHVYNCCGSFSLAIKS